MKILGYFAAALVIASLVSPARAQERTRTPTLTLTSRGEIRCLPDSADLSVTIISEAESPADAIKANAKSTSELVAALEKLNVQKSDLQTSGHETGPLYHLRKKANNKANQPAQQAPNPPAANPQEANDPFDMDEPKPSSYPAAPKPVAYHATSRLAIQVGDLARLDDIRQAVANVSDARVSNVTFGVSDSQTSANQARGVAIRQARDSAQEYAKSAGVKLGRMLSVTELEAGSDARPTIALDPFVDDEAVATPLLPGTQTISATVRVEFEIQE